MSDDLDLDALEGSGRQAFANGDMALLVNPQVFLDLIALARRTQEAETERDENERVMVVLRRHRDEAETERDAALARCADLEAALGELREAMENAGSHPEYHYMMRDRLKEQWPTLWYAIDNLLARSVPVPQEPKP